MAATLATRLHAHFAPLHDRPTPDADLLARYATHGDAGAFAALVARHGGMVAAVCRKRLGHAQDAEDAAQAVFLALARKASRVHGTAPVAAWLYGAAVKACREVARRNRRKSWVPLIVDVPGDTGLSADHDAVAALLDEVANLSDACRAAVVLCELEGCPRSLAASRLGIAEGTLSSRLASARRRLAERLTRRGFAPSALAALTGLAVGGPSFAFDLPSVTPIVQRITEAIVTTSIAWKLKLFTALGVTTATIGLALVAGEDPKPAAVPPPAVLEAAPAKPGFVLATSTTVVSGGGPGGVSQRATVAVTRLGVDGAAGPTKMVEWRRTAAEVAAVETRPTDGEPTVDYWDAKTVSASTSLEHATLTHRSTSPDSLAMVVQEWIPPWGTDLWLQNFPGGVLRDLARPPHRNLLIDATGRVVPLSDWHHCYASMVWSPDGRTLYYTVSNHANAIRHLPQFVFNDVTRLTFRVDVATGRRQRLELPATARPLAASADSQSLLIETTDRRDGVDRYTLRLATLSDDPAEPAELRRLCPPNPAQYADEAAFSPDGKRVVVARWEEVPHPEGIAAFWARRSGAACPVRQLLLADCVAGVVTPLASQPTCVPNYGRGAQWSADGKRVAFPDAKGWDRKSESLIPIEPHMLTCDPDGANPVKVTIPSPKPQWYVYSARPGPHFVAWK